MWLQAIRSPWIIVSYWITSEKSIPWKIIWHDKEANTNPVILQALLYRSDQEHVSLDRSCTADSTHRQERLIAVRVNNNLDPIPWISPHNN